MFNLCFTGNKIPKIIAILKTGKDSAIPKNCRPISLVCHTYKLYERMILNRITPVVEQRLINEQAGFRTWKPCTSQLLNLTQHIEDGYQRRMITCAETTIEERTHTILHINKSACKPRQNPSYGIPPEEQRGVENVSGEMEQD